MFWYIIGFIFFIALGVFMFRNKEHKTLGRVVGVILILFGCMVLYFGHVDTDWSAGASNWDDISAVNDHVTEEDSDISSVKNYKGYMLITLEKNTIDFSDAKSANAANTLSDCFDFAKQAGSGVAKKGVIIYQPEPKDKLTGFDILYTKDDLKNAPSNDTMLDNISAAFKKATAYNLEGANYNSTPLPKHGIKLDSKHQPKFFYDFSNSRDLVDEFYYKNEK